MPAHRGGTLRAAVECADAEGALPHDARGGVAPWHQRRGGEHRAEDGGREADVGAAAGRGSAAVHSALAAEPFHRGVQDKEAAGGMEGERV